MNVENKEMKMNIAVLGTSGDPTHRAHMWALAKVNRLFGGLFDHCLLVLAANPPNKLESTMAPAHHRFALAELATQEIPFIEISRVQMDYPAEPYAWQAVLRLKEQYGAEANIFWVVGADWAPTMHRTWNRYEYFLSIANIVVVTRLGYSYHFPHVPPKSNIEKIELGGDPRQDAYQLLNRGGTTVYSAECLLMQMSSSLIRAKIAAGESITGLVHPTVECYIYEHGLYKSV